ncbi:phospholipase A1 PLIP1, chloroplastic [Solanum pennellii]|uniref:Phospholipase A1 PLIP1, chloroplastic n=1 Tax=Solanum pennellii TaxID=28526 RepID=A0ABM1G3F4_SOLPN|nr:phospholipase A1 PLIP1, chloroplastic [Solanum pennellii]XP_015065448.1 phospholipase A1 PLIP1, chloroplastic [Solanum pennellii]XP_027772332.1 phospholipase A1 PLIP1, chloroplastic [Solanum pennellii]XP_027772333.1 phospholipase A1 PLIP1, chloroplastic [Solanum pennellii]
MACSCISIMNSPMNITSKDAWTEQDNFRRSFPSKETREKAQMRRSYSDNHLSCRANRIQSLETQPKLKSSRSTGGPFKIQLSSSFLPDSLRSFLFDIETSKDINIDGVIFESDHDHDDDNEGIETEEKTRRSNWIQRLVELKRNWIEKQKEEDAEIREDNLENSGEDCEEEGCEVDYEGDNEEADEMNIDRESFSRLLRRVSWSDSKLFSKLAFLCNMAYVIPEIKARDLERCYGLDFVTSSLVKKAEAMAIKAKFDKDSVCVPVPSSDNSVPNRDKTEEIEHKCLPPPSVAYDIAASAASYVQSRAKGLLSVGSESKLVVDDATLKANKGCSADEKDNSSQRVYKSEMAAYVAASTMTTMVAADEKQKLEAARDLQSLQSSPCEWFICDDLTTYTRCFVIQGSDSLASWKANLFFEPCKFEEMDVLVHRGIYEAAKGIYDQYMPEIMEHLQRFGNKAKFQFTGHSLGGSLSLLVNLMLLTRKVVKPSSLLPVVTFGSPFVFCGGQKVLNDLGLDENHVQSVMMHRDIVPRAFSCNYPNHVAQVLKRLNRTFRSHPCLNKNKLLYSPMGKIFIIQPDERSSAPHPLLPPGSGIYSLDSTNCAFTRRAFRVFLNSPHPLEILSVPTAYGSGGTILRDHDSSNYLKAVNNIIRQHTKLLVRRVRKQRNLIWPLLASQSPHAWSHERDMEDRGILRKEIMSSV